MYNNLPSAPVYSGAAQPMVTTRNPATSDNQFNIGQVWINTSSNSTWTLTSNSGGSATWTLDGSPTGALGSLTGNSGGAIVPVAGNINILGSTNVSVVGTAGTLTLTDAATGAFTTVNAGTFNTTAADHVGLSGSTLTAAGASADISITAVPKGAGTFTVSSGGILASAGDINATHSQAAGNVVVGASNSDNTNAASNAKLVATVGGTSAGDAVAQFVITGGQTWTLGADNSATDNFVLAKSSALGTTNALSFDQSTSLATFAAGITSTAGDVTLTAGNLILSGAGKQIQLEGGAVTDFIGEATLSAGTVTIANTNIAATDKIYLSRRAINGSTALGALTYSISAATNFVITAVQMATPAATETNDTSIVAYVIIRQN